METDKFVYDEYYADGVVYEDLFGVGSGGEDSDDCGGDFVVREYLDEYSDLRLDFRLLRNGSQFILCQSYYGRYHFII